ncbi:MAG: M1 family metallopeptidase [Bacteroidota bacterium]
MKTNAVSILVCFFFVYLLSANLSNAQPGFYDEYYFTAADSLRGMLLPQRSCYDVHYYELDLRIEPSERSIQGVVNIHFTAVESFERLQIDLYDDFQVENITYQGQSLFFERLHQALLVNMPNPIEQGKQGVLVVRYKGQPQMTDDAPWNEGFVWSKSKSGKDWVGVACEGAGASMWWPCKDHLSDEPDSVSLKIAVPPDLKAICNGNLLEVRPLPDGYLSFHWKVSYPINSYNITVNIGEFSHFSDTYYDKDSMPLQMDYYVLPENLKKAKKHFRQTKRVLKAFEHYFGKYPFPKDGYALVETPYLGMEHQGAIAYGNKYRRGYLGETHQSHMDWDYIIVHETAHEYFGNSISCKDMAEVWIHESFATYMEALFVEYEYGYKDAVDYLNYNRRIPAIYNKEPILGPLNVNWEEWKHSDHYYKGAWMLHSLRHAISDDEVWFPMLRDLYEAFQMQEVDSKDIIGFINDYTRTDYSTFFDQYLNYAKLPFFHYKLRKIDGGVRLYYRWKAAAPGFNMPILVGDRSHYQMIYPKSEWQEIDLPGIRYRHFKVATELFLVRVEHERWR